VDGELERFKTEINLAEFAAECGYRFPGGRRGYAREVTLSSLVMKHETTNDKIVIRRDSDGHWTYFSVRDAADNGTIVDFLLRRKTTNFGAVRKELRAWLGGVHHVGADKAPRVDLRPTMRDLAGVAEEYVRSPILDRSSYLRGRGIRAETLRSERFHGTIRSDDRGNILFGHLHPSDPSRIGGFERKNRGFNGFATGGTKTLWASRRFDGDRRFVFVEGAIDALSYHQIHPNNQTSYFSTGGAVGTSQLLFIAALARTFPGGSCIVLATDNDVAGEKLARQIHTVAESVPAWRHPSPIGKDWNDCLQARERDVVRSLER
jgi:hypothetical protein